jgi:hypothetical protein
MFMGVSWGMLAPFIALAITIAAMQAAVVLTGAIRSHDFRRFEDQSRDCLARRFPFPTIAPSAAEERRKSLSPFLDKARPDEISQRGGALRGVPRVGLPCPRVRYTATGGLAGAVGPAVFGNTCGLEFECPFRAW